MSHVLHFSHPQFPEGTLFSITGLGEVENGGSIELDEDAERFFVSTVGMSVEDAFSNNSTVELAGDTTLNDEDLEQLVPADRGTPEELGQTGHDSTGLEDGGQQVQTETPTEIENQTAAPTVPDFMKSSTTPPNQGQSEDGDT